MFHVFVYLAIILIIPYAIGLCCSAPRLVVSQTKSLPCGTQNMAKVKLKSVKLMSQNVRGLKSSERLEEMFYQIDRRNILAACIQETWRVGNEILEHDGGRIIVT